MARKLCRDLLTSRRFFNRSEELKGLRNMVSGQDGSLILVAGPPDSGKSALLSEFMRRERKERHTYPIHVNMRSGTYDTAASFGQELKFQASYNFLPAARKFLEKVKELKGEDDEGLDWTLIPQLTADLLKCIDSVEQVDGTDMQKLLKELESLFTGWSSLARIVARGAAYPTLVIDEANRLQEWSLNAAEEKNLMTLQAWLLMVTKEMGIANVILCSSEDFFKFWMEGHFGKDRYMVGVVGDLTEEEASTFFKQQLNREVSPELWDEIYDYIGGRINMLKLVAKQLSWVGVEEMQAEWGKCRRFIQAKSWAEIAAGMQPESMPRKWTRPVLGIPLDEEQVKGVSPRWTREDFKKLLKKITGAEGGICSFHELLQEGINKESLSSLIQHNFVHYREGSMWGGKDLEWYHGRYPVVMPVSRPKFHAMKAVLADHP